MSVVSSFSVLELCDLLKGRSAGLDDLEMVKEDSEVVQRKESAALAKVLAQQLRLSSGVNVPRTLRFCDGCLHVLSYCNREHASLQSIPSRMLGI